MNRDSVVCTVTRLLTGQQRNWYVSLQGQDIYLLQVAYTGSGFCPALHSKYVLGSFLGLTLR